MIPVYQTIFTAETGDCYRACVASILEVPIETLPNFMEDGSNHFNEKLETWSEALGIIILDVIPNEETLELFRDVYWLASGPSPRFENTDHAVVYKGKQFIHDPVPDGNGLKEIPPKSFTLFCIKDMKIYYEQIKVL